MPSNLQEKKQAVDGAIWNVVAFLIETTFDVLQTVLVIIKTPMYVHSTAKS